MPRSAFESTAMQPVIAHITQQVMNEVSRFDNELQVAIDNLLTATRDREQEEVERIQSIWAARRQVAVRFLGDTSGRYCLPGDEILV
jgi:hypothetical protein